MDNKKLLTPLELKVMNILWKLKEAFVKQILEEWDEEPKPAYNTVSTTVRILEEKGYISHKAFGRTHQYFAKMSKMSYQKKLMGNVLENAFSGSVKNLVSALLDTGSISDKEIKEIEELIQKDSEDN